MSRDAGFVVGSDGVAAPVVEARELPPRELQPSAPLRYTSGDWVAPLPGKGHDGCAAGRVTRAEECYGLKDDQLVMVQAGADGMPYLLRASELYPVRPPR
ncbi:hypothetical protein [Embleya sp. AB8]|uniref:hypothetical protein n=1 Tax=Embleya sp. AB8 TaxID=3156304 RepID=UPI003C708F39